MDSQPLEALLGLNEYEGRVYRALLAEHPATAYRLGKRSGVPLSRVYEVAARLVEKGAATVEGSEPARYRPVAPELLIASARRDAERRYERLSAELSALYTGGGAVAHRWLRGHEAVLTEALRLIEAAESEVLIAGSRSGLGSLERAVATVPRGISIRRVETATAGQDPLFLVIDRATALIGRTGPAAELPEQPAPDR
jgi:sugar-specific transcriptional regulator TrmB